MSEKKESKLSRILKNLEKKYGRGIISKLDNSKIIKVDTISSGSIELDIALGGGWPRGRVIELFGNEASGKSTLTLKTMAEAQKAGLVVALIDTEYAFDSEYAKLNEINVSDLLFSQPDNAEQAMTVLQELIASEEIGLIVVDSVAAMSVKAEIEGEMEDMHMGIKARLMGKMLRKITPIVAKTNTCVIFVNQTREKIGVMYGSNITTPGGKALKFHSSVRVQTYRIKTLKKGEIPVGSRIKAKVTKNKVAPPFNSGEFEIYNDEGMSQTADIIRIAMRHGIIKKSGSWLSFEGNNLAQGREKTRILLKEDKKLYNNIKEKVLALLGKKEKKSSKNT